MQHHVYVGNVGKDPELKFLQSGIAVCEFSVAVNKSVKKGDEWVNETVWIDCVAWRGRAEAIKNYVSKGTTVTIFSSDVKAEAWIGKDGKAASKIKVTVDDIKWSGKGEGGNNQNRSEEDFTPPPDNSKSIPF